MYENPKNLLYLLNFPCYLTQTCLAFHDRRLFRPRMQGNWCAQHLAHDLLPLIRYLQAERELPSYMITNLFCCLLSFNEFRNQSFYMRATLAFNGLNTKTAVVVDWNGFLNGFNTGFFYAVIREISTVWCLKNPLIILGTTLFSLSEALHLRSTKMGS